jgi:HSP20 family protein
LLNTEISEETVMKRPTWKRSLITLGLLTLVGTVGAETYYTHKVAERMDTQGNQPRTEQNAPEASSNETPPGTAEWHPWTEMRRIQQQIARAFEESWQRMHADIGALEPIETSPDTLDVTLKEDKGDYVVTASLPGIDEGDLDVSLDGRLLRISAQSQGQEHGTAHNGEVVREETYASSFQRAFTLPGPVDASKMHTQFEDGILTVTIPKAAS